MELVYNGFLRKGSTSVAYLDKAKAFDKLSHEEVIYKLMSAKIYIIMK